MRTEPNAHHGVHHLIEPDVQHTSFVGSINNATADAVGNNQISNMTDGNIADGPAPRQRAECAKPKVGFFERAIGAIKEFFDIKPDLFAGIVTFTIGIVTFNPVIIGVGAGLIGFYAFRKLIAM